MAIADLAYIDDTGYHFPDYPTVLAMLQDEYRTIYGADVYLEADSQDGQWIAVIALAMYELMALGATTYNSFSPLTALKDALSRNVKINGIRRQVATYSTADLKIVGQTGTQIEGGIVEDTLGQKWALPAVVVVPLAGEIVVTATAVEIGTVSAAANSINKISTPTLGWQTVTNLLPATEGNPVETDAELRQRQTVSTEIPSLSVLDGITGLVASLAGVSRVASYENDSDATDADGIPEHSISLVVEGGVAQDIGNAIALKKTPGTGTYGTTPVATVDKYGVPNTINFFRPTIATIGVEITIVALAGYTTGFSALIKQAVADFINSLKIGEDVYLTRLYGPALLLGTEAAGTFNITLLRIKKNAGAFGTANIVIAFNEAAASAPANVTILP